MTPEELTRARCTPCSKCYVSVEPPTLPPLDVASKLLFLAAVLRTDFQSKACGLIGIYAEETRIGLPSRRGLASLVHPFGIDVTSDWTDVTFFDFS